MDSEERIAQIPGSFPASDFVRNLRPQTSQSQLRKKRSESPALQNGNHVSGDPSLDRPMTGSATDHSQDEPQYRVLHSARTSEDKVRQNGSYMYGSQQAPSTRPNQGAMPFRTSGPSSSRPSQESLQERGRPSAADPKAGPRIPMGMRSESSTENSRPPTSDSRGREPSQEQWRAIPDPTKASLHPPSFKRAVSSEGSNYNEHGQPTTVQDSTPNVTPPAVTAENIDPKLGAAPPLQASVPTPPETPTESHRPGLGPMIKTKRSNKEIASTFRKAATAYNAFKPRAGGAADKLREQQQSPTGEPDGITGVVPAPSLLKGVSQTLVDGSRSQTPDLNKSDQLREQGTVPTVKVDSPPQQPVQPAQVPNHYSESSTLYKPQEAESEKPHPPEKTPAEPRRQRKSDHSAQYARALTLDPQTLTGRTFDIEAALSDFGWGEESSQRCTYEELQANVRKEVARAEAGGWLNAIQQNDDRMIALANMMDRVIIECDELDGLLTLYGVELSVCPIPLLRSSCC